MIPCVYALLVQPSALEFMVTRAILRTAVAPTHQDRLDLSAIVRLRSLLNDCLDRKFARAKLID